MHWKILLFFSFLFTCALSCSSFAQDTVQTETISQVPEPIAIDTLQVLFIGNSYTFYHNMPGMVQELANRSKKALKCVHKTNPGWTLQMHLQDSLTHRQIKKKDWDLVIFQEYSLATAIPTYIKHNTTSALKRFDESIPTTIKAIYQTWARPLAGKHCMPESSFCTKLFMNYAEMQNFQDSVFENLRSEVKMPLIPVGLAFREVILNEKGIDLFDSDQHHPSEYGSYLAACVFYASFFGESPEKSLWYGKLPIKKAKLLQKTAWWIYQKEKQRCHLHPLLN